MDFFMELFKIRLICPHFIYIPNFWFLNLLGDKVIPMNQQSESIVVACGELSGEMYAAELVTSIKHQRPELQFYGMGSDTLKRAGVEIVVDTKQLSLIGVLELITKFPKIIAAFFTLRRLIRRQKPALIILVDYPGFNLLLAGSAKKMGVKVFYYISPKVWAWNTRRIRRIKKYVDTMAVIFPFEVEFYQKHDVNAVFVGNPLLKLVENYPSPKLSLKNLSEAPNQEIVTIGLFPGSRSGEIRRLLPVMLAAVNLLQSRYPKLQVYLAKASSIAPQEITKYLSIFPLPVTIMATSHEVIQRSDLILAASGTATLEITLMQVPLVILYKLSWWEYQLAKRLIKIPHVGLCNILAGRMIVPELLQQEASPAKLAETAARIIDNPQYRQEMLAAMQQVKTSLTDTPALNCANLVLTMLRSY